MTHNTRHLALLAVPLILFFSFVASAHAERDWFGDDEDSDYRSDERSDYDSEYEETRRERRKLEQEREKLKEEREQLQDEREQNIRRQPVESCPSGFHPGSHRCTAEDRKRGCKDMRMQGGTTCNAGPFS